MDSVIKFGTSGSLRILQVSDAQDMHIPRRAMLRMLNEAYDLLKPDLVLLTGDNILSNHLDDAVIGTRTVVKTREDSYKRIEKAIANILDPLESRGIPFAFIFGNHDDMNVFSKDELAEIYMRYSYCISPYDESGEVACGTYNIPIYNREGDRIVRNLWMLDSAGNDDNGKNGYCYVSENIINWYKRKSDSLKAKNGGMPVMSLMFQHIPIPETLELLCEVDKKTRGCVEHDGHFYALNSTLASGTLGEYPHVCEKNFGQFVAAVNRNDVKAIVFGHDHKNCFTGSLHGIDIIQTPCASFRCYGNSERGVRLFELSDSSESYTSKSISYYDIFGKGPVSRLRYIMDADDMAVQKRILISAATLTASAAVVACARRRKKQS